MPLILAADGDLSQKKVRVEFLDKNDDVAETDGPPTWTTTNLDVAIVTPDPENPLIATIQALKKGTVQVQAKADGAFGSPIRFVTAVLDVEVHAGEAVSASISPVVEETPAPETPAEPAP